MIPVLDTINEGGSRANRYRHIDPAASLRHDCIDEEHVPLISAIFLSLYSSGDGRLSLISGEGAAMAGGLCLGVEVEESGNESR